MSCLAVNPLLSVLRGCTFTTEQHRTWPRDSSCQNSNYDTLKSTLRSSEGLDFILQDISDSIFCHFLKNIWLQLQDSSFLEFHQGAQKLQQIASKR